MAATTPKTADTPKADKPNPEGVGVAALAAHLRTDPRTLRGFLRRTDRAVGKGERYSWPSLKSPEVRKIETDWTRSAGPGRDRGQGREQVRPWLVLRALGEDRYVDLGVHYLTDDPESVDEDFRFEWDNPNPSGDCFRLYPVSGNPVDAFDR